MSLIATLRDYLLTVPGVEAWVGARIYTLELPQSVTTPAIRISEIDRVGSIHLRGTLALHRSRVQVDCLEHESHSDAYENVHALADAVRGDCRSGAPSGLAGWRGLLSGIPIEVIEEADQREVYDSPTRTVMIQQEFFVTWQA